MTLSVGIFPLNVTGLAYFGFVLVVFGLYYAFPRRQNLILLAASYIFYLTWDWKFAVTLLAVTAVNYLAAHKLEFGQRVKSAAATHFFYLGLLVNLAPLFYFKYLGYLAGHLIALLNLPGGSLNSLNILLPVGMSFYVLQAISYQVDVYRGQLAPSRDPLTFALFLAYFPKLLVGPIERARTFLPQLTTPRVVDNAALSESLARILIGLGRKLVIANTILAAIPPQIFTTPAKYRLPDLLFWWIAYIFMLYNDFAGYTSIARGVSGLFGIDLVENFKQPFFSAGFIDFWGRWHISLSNWLRDYIYMPLSRAMLRRNPNGKYLPNVIVPPIVTMLVSGLWHGINPHFLLWGGLTGLIQAIERVVTLRRPAVKRVDSAPPRLLKALAGLGFILLLTLLVGPPFLLEIPESLAFWTHVILPGAAKTLSLRSILRPVTAILLALAIDWFQHKTQDDVFITKWPPWARSLALATLLLLLFLTTRAHTDTPFIYQEF